MDFESGRPLKRFKHQSYQATLKTVHLPSASHHSGLDDDLADSDSHFSRTLDQWRHINLSPAFLSFAAQAQELSASVPLLLHHSDELVRLWIEATTQADDDALRALLDLLQNLLHELRDTLQPSYTRLLDVLLAILPRSHSAETLTILLMTMSSFFKYLLGSQVPRLQETWSALTSTLIKCNTEVRRAVAEVWATVLRRCKGEMRHIAVTLLLGDLETLAETGAWTFVYAFKSVARTLHTCTSALFAELLTIYLSAQHHLHIEKLLRRVLTALIHHCDKADHFAPISDLLVSRLVDANPKEQTQIMTLLSTTCSVRKGSRMNQKQISKILTHLAQRDILSNETKQVLTLGAAALVAGEMPVWMGGGRRFIEASWENPVLGLALAGALSDLDWGGWRLIEFPFTLKHTTQMIDTNPSPTLTLLASLMQAQRLGDIDEGWSRQLTTSIRARIDVWDISTIDFQELSAVLALSPILHSIGPALAQMATRALFFSQPGMVSEEINEAQPPAAMVFGACIKALAENPSFEWPQQEIPIWISSALKKWPKCQFVLEGLAAISRQHATSCHMLLADVYPCLQQTILSHTHRLRLYALQILTSPMIEQTQSGDALRRCLQGEEATLNVEGERERVLRITRVPLIVKDGDEIGADICVRWLIAQLKVNLLPLWMPTAKALAVLSQRFGELVWNLAFTELSAIVHGDISKDTESMGPKDELDVMLEDERSWRDPSAAKLRSTVDTWLNGDPARKNVFEIECENLDVANYESQILHFFGEVTSLTQRFNAGLIRLFLSFGSPDLPSKPPRRKLSHWLTLFSKLDNPKSFHQTSKLQALYRSLLSHPDRNLQSVALTCLMNYKPPHLVPYENHFRALLDSTRWRDEVTSFDISMIEDGDRSEVVDVIIRLFFGLMLERHGRTKGVDRRASLLSKLGSCRVEELRLLVDLMLEPFSMSSSSVEVPDSVKATEKQQIGFMNLLGDVMKRMGSSLVPYWPSLLLITIKLVAVAQAKLDLVTDAIEHQEMQDDEDETGPTVDVAPPLHTSSTARPMRSVRQLGIKRIIDFVRCDVPFDFHEYLPSTFAAFISPRLGALERENTQSPSALLELFYEWSMQKQYILYLVAYDDRVLPKTYACLQTVNVKPAVVSRIFDIVGNILAISAEEPEVADRVLKPHISTLLNALAIELPKSGGSRSDLLHRQISILSQIAQFTTDSSQARRLLQHFSPLLTFPHKIIAEKSKIHVLKLMGAIMPMVDDFRDHSSVIYAQTYDLFAKLFQTLRSKAGRLALLDAFGQLCPVDSRLHRLHELLRSLNAFSTKRMDEPDFELRLRAFNELNEVLYTQLSAHEWLPVLHNMLQSIQDPEELAVRTNAAYSLKRFIDSLSTQPSSEFETLFTRTLFPALRRGLLSKVELVRNEILSVLAYGISKCDSIATLSELRPLLAGGDTEADFFNNIHHIQNHRRTRALRRLVEFVEKSSVRSATIADIFLPVIGHFIVNAPTTDHILVDVAIVTTGSLARRLNWGAYNTLVRQYMALVKAKTPAERACVRALVTVLENFHFPMDAIAAGDESSTAEHNDLLQMVGVEPSQMEGAERTPEQNTASVGNSVSKKIVDAVTTRLLPSLLQHLDRRDDDDDVLRIPISAGIAQVACHLPQTSKDTQILRLLTILCQIFRSRSLETRALARTSLCKVAVIIGPSYLARIMNELRTALLRGPHLHILATVVHALLVHVTSSDHVSSFKDLGECAHAVSHISAEVIFGQSGRDVQSEGFTSTFAEVRRSSSKGLDSFAILAKHITPSRISTLLSPIREIMRETGSSKTLQLVDDVLRRVSEGLNANEYLSPLDYLSLCHTLIQQNSHFLKQVTSSVPGVENAKRDFMVQTKRHLENDTDHYAHNSFRFVVLGLELFNIAIRRGKFDLRDPEVISRLESTFPAIGNTLYSQDSPVIIQGLKATALIVKCPLNSIEQSLPTYVQQILEIVRQAGHTESETVQTALRTLAVIVRDCTTSQVKEKDLVYLLEVITPELEDHTRQSTAFGLLRAIISRKFVVVEIYDIMEKVADIMVTNQTGQVQELCRAILLQFLLDYPQGKGRLRKQMSFLAQNLSYVFESGRRSVMELLNAVFTKFDTGLLREYADLFFVALVMAMANDDSSKCREMAAELIKLLFKQLDVGHRTTILSHLHSWSSEKAQLQLSRVSVQVYGLVVDTLQQGVAPYMSDILEDMNAIICRSAAEVQRLESNLTDQSGMEVEVEWQLPYHALTVINKLIQIHPDLIKDEGKVDWSSIRSHLLFPHMWVRKVSSRSIGLLFNAVPPGLPDPCIPDDQLVSLPGLIEVARCSCLQLKSEALDSSLSLQLVKNLFYIGKCFCTVSTVRPPQDDVADELDSREAELPLGQPDKLENIRTNPLPWLFSKLSYQARSAYLDRRNRSTGQDNWSEQPLAVFRWFAAMASHMDPVRLERYLVHILNPVYRILDDHTIHDHLMGDVKTLAQELQTLVQKQVGTTKFADVYNQIRQGIMQVRRDRKNKKAIQMTTNHQAAARRKIHHNQAKRNLKTSRMPRKSKLQ